MHIVLSLSFAMLFGLILNRICKYIHLPNVTGYLLAGLFIGPYVLKLVSGDELNRMSLLSSVALGFIAFSIGGEFKLEVLKGTGKSILTITFFQALAATAFVDVGLLVCGFAAPLAITLGAIATATAPAATLLVIRQYKARGIVTDTLLPVVALDDAVGLIVFAISIALAKVLANGTKLTVKAMLLEPLLEIFLSLLVGSGIGLIVALGTRLFHSRANRICLVVCGVFFGTALADVWNLSSLLLCMMIGAMVANFSPEYEKVLDGTDRWTPPLFMLFFVISGAQLELSVLPSVGLLGVLYILLRSLGKYFGAFAGACAVKAHPNIRKYLGVTLLPQAGVAIGMSQMVIPALPAYGQAIRAVVLSATLIYELVGPLLTKLVLTKAGEIVPESKPTEVPAE